MSPWRVVPSHAIAAGHSWPQHGRSRPLGGPRRRGRRRPCSHRSLRAPWGRNRSPDGRNRNPWGRNRRPYGRHSLWGRRSSWGMSSGRRSPWALLSWVILRHSSQAVGSQHAMPCVGPCLGVVRGHAVVPGHGIARGHGATVGVPCAARSRRGRRRAWGRRRPPATELPQGIAGHGDIAVDPVATAQTTGSSQVVVGAPWVRAIGWCACTPTRSRTCRTPRPATSSPSRASSASPAPPSRTVGRRRRWPRARASWRGRAAGAQARGGGPRSALERRRMGHIWLPIVACLGGQGSIAACAHAA